MIQLSDYIVQLQGRDYLPVAPRIAAMRSEHPDWSIVTELCPGGEHVRATVADGDGRILATAHKTVTAFRGGAVEKAETGAIGRALAVAGYGTLQALELDEGDDIADAPVERPAKAPAPAKPAAPATADGWRERIAAAGDDVRALGSLWRDVAFESNAHRRGYAQAAIVTAFAPAITARAADGLDAAQQRWALGVLAEMGVVCGDAGQPEKCRSRLDDAATLASRAHDEVASVAAQPAEVGA